MDLTLVVPRALLATDLVDSTLLNQDLGDAAMAAVWAKHDRVARDLIRNWRGLEIGRSDGFLAVFDDPSDAVGCAVAYQDSLRSMKPTLRARVGVHFGAIRVRLNDSADVEHGATPFEVDGLALPVVMRVMSAAIAGQTLLTESVGRALTGRRRLVSHGHWRLKGVEAPVELLEAETGCAPWTPPPESPKAYRVTMTDGHWMPSRKLPHSLPANRDTFFGRTETLAEIASRFESGARLITILGPGGIGKTRLAMRYAHSWLGDFPGGAWFCDLSHASTADGVLHGLAQGVGQKLGTKDPTRQIALAIAAKGPCLIVLDNVEQVALHAGNLLRHCLAAAPESRFLVTSRAVLSIAGEELVITPPMAVPDAIALFKARSDAAGGDGLKVDKQDPTVVKLVETLDCLPLAIELAAVRTRLLSPQELLNRMHERFRLLTRHGGPQDRQSTLWATLQWSWELLPLAAQSALAQLSVFEGGWTLAAAEMVIDTGPTSPDLWVEDMLQVLVDQSLIRRGADSRFSMLRSVQDFAASQLSSGQAEVAESPRRHWEYFANVDEQTATADRCADLDNIVLACRRATAAGDCQAACRSLALADVVLKLHGPISALAKLAEAVLALPALSKTQYAVAARVLGNARLATGNGDEAIEIYRRGLDAAKQSSDQTQLVRLQCALAEPLMRSGDRDQAQALIEQAHSAAQSLADLQLQFLALNALGTLAFREGQLPIAKEKFQAALDIAGRLGVKVQYVVSGVHPD